MEEYNEKILSEITDEDLENILFLYIIDEGMKKGEISTTFIQSKLEIKYITANKILEKIDSLGIISKKEGSKPRKFLISQKDWEEQKHIYKEKFKINDEIAKICIKTYTKNLQEEEADPLLLEVINFVVKQEKISREEIKNKFQISYGRVERIIEQMDMLDITYDIHQKDFEKVSKKIKQLHLRRKIKEDIEKNGYEKVKKDNIDKLIELFKEMLEYKNKEYNKNWDFREWIENIDTYYHFYHRWLLDILYEVQFNRKFFNLKKYDDDSSEKIDEVEIIIDLIELYNTLSDKEDGYKEYANFYREFELKEGQTYSDLYKLEKEKFIKLFKEMLDFAKVKYENSDFTKLSYLVRKHYPFYSKLFAQLNALTGEPHETYISILDCMETMYDNLSKNYKNREIYLKEYQEELEEDISDYEE